MSTRTPAGHIKICDGKILWANEDAHHLLSYPPGELAGMQSGAVLMPGGLTLTPDGRTIELRDRHERSLLVDMRAEPMEDQCVLWTFGPGTHPAHEERTDASSFHDALTSGAERKLEEQEEPQLRLRIQQGLTQNEFFLVYQPKVDMLRGTVIGVEALIRWQHPERGLLRPASFVPLIEDHELIEQLGDWVIGEAVRQAAGWLAVGLQTSISVNVSPRHLLRPDFVGRLAAHLGRFPQLPLGVLELEILETTAIKDFGAVADFIEACKALGVPVTMDDFGTGYSSLTYLRQLPVTALKLDQSFVRGMLDDVEDQAIVKGILVMAHGMGLKAIAEGVESTAHGNALMALGCTLGQGYGIARPLSAVAVPGWIADFERDPPWGRTADDDA